MTITGLQHAGAHVEVQQAFEAPQHPLLPCSNPASARLAMLIAASIAPVILIHRIELSLLPLGISNLGRPDPWNAGVGQPRNSRQLFCAACDARRSSSGCYHHPVPVNTTVKRTSVHRLFRPAEPQTPQSPHSSCCNHNGCPATIAFGGTRPMNRRDRHDSLNLSNRYFAIHLRRFSIEFSVDDA